MILARIALNRFPTVAKCAKTSFLSKSIYDGGIPKNVSNARNAHTYYYRECCKPEKYLQQLADITQGFAWWWILWHFGTEPGHVFGEFSYPDASKWTDEELGIPLKRSHKSE